MFTETAQFIEESTAPAGSADVKPVTRYEDGEAIFEPGDRAGNIHVVVHGAVRVYRLHADGRRQITGFFLPGEVFGFETDEEHRFFADAVGSTGIRTIRSAHEGARQLLPMVMQGLSRALEHQLLLGRQGAAERVALFLLDMAQRQGNPQSVRLPMTRLDIADYLGVTIETVSRTLSRLKADGTICLNGFRDVEVKRAERLRRLAA